MVKKMKEGCIENKSRKQKAENDDNEQKKGEKKLPSAN